jgi:hypothetical protein
VIPEHDFLLDREVKLGGMAVPAPKHTQGVEWFGSHLIFGQEIVAPRLLAKVNDWFKVR